MRNGGRWYRSYRAQLYILGSLLILAVAMVIWLLANHPQVAPAVTSGSTSTPRVQLALYSSGSVSNPTAIAASGVTGDKRLFVTDQSGKIRIINSSGTVVSEPFLDISRTVTFSGEAGLLGLVFSPTYATDGYFYVNYIDKDQNTVVSRYHVSQDANTADASTAQVILKQKQPFQNHNGGTLAFGPDRYLYIAFGDGGSSGDPGNRAQDTSTWLGKILRVDVSSLPYKSPSDNPYITTSGVKPEIWGMGLRNPRMSFDSKTHELYIADVGQDKIEEINVEGANKGGNNYGWRCYEGDHDFATNGCKGKNNYVLPALTYDHTENRCAIIGGYVYRGKAYLDLVGKYFYADYCGGQLYYMSKNGNAFAGTKAAQTPYKVSAFGQDNSGELYAADYATGAIYRIQDAPGVY